MNCHFLYIMEHLCRFRKVLILLWEGVVFAATVFVWAESDHLCTSSREPVIFSTERTVAIFPLSSGDNEVLVHLASDRLIKKRNRICQSRIGAAWRWAGRWAGGRGCDGGRPDNRITAENESIKGEEAIVTQSPRNMDATQRHSGPLRRRAIVGFCWGGCLSLGSCAFRMWL